MFGINKKIRKTEELFGEKINYIHKRLNELTQRVDNQDKVIDDILHTLEPILFEHCKGELEVVVDEFSNALEKLFVEEPKKSKKSTKSTQKKKCEKCESTKQSEKKRTKKGDK